MPKSPQNKPELRPLSEEEREEFRKEFEKLDQEFRENPELHEPFLEWLRETWQIKD